MFREVLVLGFILLMAWRNLPLCRKCQADSSWKCPGSVYTQHHGREGGNTVTKITLLRRLKWLRGRRNKQTRASHSLTQSSTQTAAVTDEGWGTDTAPGCLLLQLPTWNQHVIPHLRTQSLRLPSLLRPAASSVSLDFKAFSLKGGIPMTFPSCSANFLKLLRELREAYLPAYYKLVY